MHRINSSNAGPNGEWVAGNPLTGQLPTAATAAWFNAVQEELINYIVSRGITPSTTDNSQLKVAITQHMNDFVTEKLSQWTPPGTGGSAYTHPSSHPASMITQDAAHQFVTAEEKAQLVALLEQSTGGSHMGSDGLLTYLPEGETTPVYCKGQLLQYFEMIRNVNLGRSAPTNVGGSDQQVTSDWFEFTPKSPHSRLFVTLSLGIEYEGRLNQDSNYSPKFIIIARKRDARDGVNRDSIVMWNHERVDVSIDGVSTLQDDNQESLIISYSRRVPLDSWEGMQRFSMDVKTPPNARFFDLSFVDFFIEEFS